MNNDRIMQIFQLVIICMVLLWVLIISAKLDQIERKINLFPEDIDFAVSAVSPCPHGTEKVCFDPLATRPEATVLEKLNLASEMLQRIIETKKGE